MLLETEVNAAVRSGQERQYQQYQKDLQDAASKEDIDDLIKSELDPLLNKVWAMMNQFPDYQIKDYWPFLHTYYSECGMDFTMCGRFENSFDYE